jgi:hypothetical protein
MAYFKCACDGGGGPGTPGAPGLSVLHDHVNGQEPDGAHGRIGEFLIDLDTYVMWGPKESNSTWAGAASVLLLGATGLTGTSILHGTGAPVAEGNNGDFYLDLYDYTLYGPKAAGSWPGTGQALIGAAGADAQWFWQSVWSSSANYVAGDIVFHNGSSWRTPAASSNQQPGVAGSWELVAQRGDDGVATNGVDGNTILSRDHAPASPADDNDGVIGDYWIDTTTYTLYGPKTGAAWPASGTVLPGAAGADGTKIFAEAGSPLIVGTYDNAPVGSFYIDLAHPVTLYGPKLNAFDWNGGYAQQIEGPPGTPGSNGTVIYSGAGTPATTATTGAPGDFYVDTQNKNLWGPADSAGDFVSFISLIGLTGDTGAPGSKIFVEAGLPTGGADGDLWINSSNGYLYGPKTSGSWNTGSWVSLKGPTGNNGNTIWNGNGTPATNSVGGTVGGGADGDFYIDTADIDGPRLYGPKAAGAWPTTGVLLKGQKGDTGSFGGAVFQYNFNSSEPIYTLDQDPTSGKLLLSQLATNSTSNKYLHIHKLDKTGADATAYLQTIDDSLSSIRGHVKIEKAGDPTVFQYFAIWNAHTEKPLPSPDPSFAYFKVPVTLLVSNGSFSNGDILNATFVRTGDKGNDGTGGVVSVHGAFHSDANQTANTSGSPAVIQPTAMLVPETDLSNDVSQDPTDLSKIIVGDTGTYNVQFSAQIRHIGGGSGTVNIWFRVNGVDVPASDTRVTIPASGQYVVAAWNILLSLNAGDYVQVMWQPDATDVILQAEAAAVGHPSIPSVIVTVDRLAYSGRSAYDDWVLQGNSGSVQKFLASLTGPSVWSANLAGSTLGASNPANGGLPFKEGDFFIDIGSTYFNLYGPFAPPATWPAPVELIGRDGDTPTAPATYSVYYGTGKDGSKSFADQAAVTAWTDGLLALFTASGLVEYQDLTIPAGASFDTMGFPVIVRGTLYLGNGASIHADGASATGQAAGVGRLAAASYLPGNGTIPSTTSRFYGGSYSGGAGSLGTGGPGSGSGPAANDPCWAGPGGNGGAVSASSGGNGGPVAAASQAFRGNASNISSIQYLSTGVMPHHYMASWTAGNFRIPQGGAGGGGGRSLTIGSNGGGGGAGGGVCVVFARNIVLLGSSARISANGGNGTTGTGPAATGGGGGGGGGYVAVVTTEDLSLSSFNGLAITANGGTGGAGRNTGNNGANGSNGLVIKHIG